jgi:hypothetical protein
MKWPRAKTIDRTIAVAVESKRARTRTSLTGVTIYQPDVEPSDYRSQTH